MFGLLLAAHGKYFAVCFWGFCRPFANGTQQTAWITID
jgi:hypothetical protein